MKELTLAYLAGLFDGEGCVSITTHRRNETIYYTKTLIFTQGDREYCELFKIELGVGRIYERKRKVNKTVYDWRANGKDALIAAQILLPYLRIKRLEVINKILT